MALFCPPRPDRLSLWCVVLPTFTTIILPVSTYLHIDFKALSSLTKQMSLKVVENGGMVRSIQNHGLRPFPHRVQAKYPDYKTGQRYYEQGRYVSVYYDANPATQQQVQVLIGMNDQVLRQFHLKARSKLDYSTMQRPDKNPYLKRAAAAMAQEEAESVTVQG